MSPSAAAITAAVLAVLVASAPAQRQFDELRKRWLPGDSDDTNAVVLSDIDGSGASDIVFGNNGQNRLYLNTGNGTFIDATAARMPIDNDSTHAVVLGDVDGDGDLDMVCGNWGQNRLYLNNGRGIFADATATHMPVDNDRTNAVALGDVDGDGDLDMICGNSTQPGPQNRLYLNNGNGTFTDATAARMPIASDGTFAVVLGDFDGNGALDIVCGNDGQNRLYLNNGSGTFNDATAVRMPADNDTTHAIAIGDVDRDGDRDMICGNTGPNGQQNRLYLNNGFGTFIDWTAARMPIYTDSTAAVALGDVDGDGDLDMVCGNYGYRFGEQQNQLYLNNGSGTFTDATAVRMPIDRDDTSAIALGDVDGDGDLDLVCGNGGYNRLYLNNGSGIFTDATAARMPGDRDSTSAVALGDVDGDGDLDLVCGNGRFPGQQNRLYLNNGNGAFIDATAARMPFDSDQTAAVAFGDVDGDGDLDLVCGNWSQQNRLYLNNGSGTFTDATGARMPIDSDPTPAVALGDVDGDGDLDLVCGNGLGYQNRLYLNNGSGTFTDATAARMPVGNGETSAVALGDVDGDGDLDLVCGNRPYGAQNRLYLNNGSGTFTDATAARMPVDGNRTNAVALGDIDRDGDLDLVFGNSSAGRFEDPRNRLYLNNGSGFFTDATTARMPVDRDWTHAVALGDVDGDGDLDMVCGNGYASQNRLYLNNGNGTFTDATATRMPVENNWTHAVALGDVDGDGDVDLVCGNDGPNLLHLNLLRQLDVPFVPGIGKPYTLEAYVRYGPPSVVDVAVPFLSAARVSVPWAPFGTLRLDPTQLVALPAIAIPRPAGVGSVSFTIPNDGAFAGITLYSQAMLLSQPFPALLTNGTVDVILR